MIDFRFHIVSIMAIFLALGLGVVAGTTVLDRLTVDTLRGRVDDLRTRLDEHRREITELRVERNQASGVLAALAPRVSGGVLDEAPVLFVGDHTGGPWHSNVRESITGAGGLDAGSIELTEKWMSRRTSDREELRAAFEGHELGVRDPATDAATILGQLLLSGPGSDLVARLGEAGFLRVSPNGPAPGFPPPGALVVVLASADNPLLAELAQGSAGSSPTLAVAANVDELGALEELRSIEDAPQLLATFDSADNDPHGLGTVLALQAAVRGRGGHFGRGPGLQFLPPPE